MRIRPASGRSRPATRRKVVVFPAPVGPSNTTNAPSSTVSERSETALVAPKRFDTPSSVTSAMGELHRGRRIMERGQDGAAGGGVEQRDAVRTEFEPNAVADRHLEIRGQSGFRQAMRGRDGDDLCRTEIFRAEN